MRVPSPEVPDNARVTTEHLVATDVPRQAAQVRKIPLIWAVAASTLIVAVMIGAYFIPIPSVTHLHEWGSALGPAFVVVFFLAYTLCTIAPIPRTAFTVSSGLLFGPWVGFGGAMIATVSAACAAFFLVRILGRDRVAAHLGHPVVARIDRRLATRGWLAVLSLRMIAACPFAVANYSAGLSAVPFGQYFLATVVGVAPGTASVVILGAALAGAAHPWTIGLGALFFLVGISGLIYDEYLDRREHIGAG